MIMRSNPASCLWRLLLLCACLIACSRAVCADDTIHFDNGDLLHGEMVSASGGKDVVWKRPDAKHEINMAPEHIDKIDLARNTAIKYGGHSSSIHLTNGDIIRANLVSLDSNTLFVTSSYAGELQIKRLMIQSILPSIMAGSGIFSGPTDLKEWTMSSANTWALKEGALHPLSSGTIGRNVELPDRSRIDFNVAWKTSYPQFRFAFYTDDLKSYSRNSYVLRMSSSYIRLYRYLNNSSTSLDTANYQMQPGKQNSQFCILTDKKAKTIAVLIDGAIVKQWSDPSGFQNVGKGILFYSYSDAPLKFSKIRVAEWDGSMPGTEPEAEAKKGKTDFIELIGGDKISGKLESIREGKLTFSASYAAFDIPVDRLASIVFSGKNAGRARRNTHDILVELDNRTMVTVDMKTIADGKVTGESENLGPISIALDAIKRLKFNIYREKEEKGDSW